MQPQYRGYSQPVSQRPGAHAPGLRRGGIGPMMTPGPHHQVPVNQAAYAAQERAQAHATEQAKRKSRKPTDKSLPEGIDDCSIGDGAQRYRELRDFERRLDATMTRKRLDFNDSVNRNAKRYQTLRIWISNTVENQPWQTTGQLHIDSFDFSNNAEPSYRVKIEGRLLDDDEEAGKDEDEAKPDVEDDGFEKMDVAKPKAANASARAGQVYRFSHFFKALTADFDRGRNRPAPDASVEWKKPERMPQSATNLPSVADFDELTFKRNADENQNITINLYRHEEPPHDRFQLSPELAEVVDMTEGTRAEIVMGLWGYIKLMNLQEDEEKRNFRCDELLKKVIRREAGYIPMLHDYIQPHLKPLPPIKLAYTIRVDEEFHKDPQPTVYDVLVVVDDPLRNKLVPLVLPQYGPTLKEVGALDDQLATLVQAISASKAKLSFLDSMAADPAGFVRRWLSSQKRDLEIILGEATRGGGEDAAGDEWRRGGKDSVWAIQNARESVNVLLSKPPGHR